MVEVGAVVAEEGQKLEVCHILYLFAHFQFHNILSFFFGSKISILVN